MRREAGLLDEGVSVHRLSSLEITGCLLVVEHRDVALQLLTAHLRDEQIGDAASSKRAD